MGKNVRNVMKINLKKYLNERDRLRALKKPDGPVVTISRQYGCGSQKIVLKLLSKISKFNETKPKGLDWKFINKEIIEESARELHLLPQRLEERVIMHGNNIMGDIFSGLSMHYNLSDEKIIETVRDIIETYSRTGNIIVVGRGGAPLTQKIKASLHIRLIAPMDWRIKKISESKGIPVEEAEELVIKVDRERLLWTEHLSGKGYRDDWFDVFLNRHKLSDDEIVDLIFHLMLKKRMI